MLLWPVIAEGVALPTDKRIKSFRIAKPRRKLRWTERGRDDRNAEAYGFFR